MIIAPSILAADFLHLGKDVETVNAHADIFHLDIMDGTFVPNISFGFPVVEAVAREARKPMDVHLMIVHPEKYVERFCKVVIPRRRKNRDARVHRPHEAKALAAVVAAPRGKPMTQHTATSDPASSFAARAA